MPSAACILNKPRKIRWFPLVKTVKLSTKFLKTPNQQEESGASDHSWTAAPFQPPHMYLVRVGQLVTANALSSYTRAGFHTSSNEAWATLTFPDTSLYGCNCLCAARYSMDNDKTSALPFFLFATRRPHRRSTARLPDEALLGHVPLWRNKSFSAAWRPCGYSKATASQSVCCAIKQCVALCVIHWQTCLSIPEG